MLTKTCGDSYRTKVTSARTQRKSYSVVRKLKAARTSSVNRSFSRPGSGEVLNMPVTYGPGGCHILVPGLYRHPLLNRSSLSARKNPEFLNSCPVAGSIVRSRMGLPLRIASRNKLAFLFQFACAEALL